MNRCVSSSALQVASAWACARRSLVPPDLALGDLRNVRGLKPQGSILCFLSPASHVLEARVGWPELDVIFVRIAKQLIS